MVSGKEVGSSCAYNSDVRRPGRVSVVSSGRRNKILKDIHRATWEIRQRRARALKSTIMTYLLCFGSARL